MTKNSNAGKIPMEVLFEHCEHMTIIYAISPKDAAEQMNDLYEKYEGWCPHCWSRHHTPERPF